MEPNAQDTSAGSCAVRQEEETYWQAVWKRFRRHKLAVYSSVVLLFLIFVVITVPNASARTYRDIAPEVRYSAPSVQYPFGTDQLGRDTFLRCVQGGRISIMVGLAGALSATLLGTLIGGIAGYYGGTIDSALMRFTDMMLALPLLPLMLFVVLLFEGGPETIISVIVVFFWMGTARLVRSRFLELKSEPFVMAARSAGATDVRIIKKHLLPNTFDILLINATLMVCSAILYEATLSFLGFGIQPPMPTWGNMLRRSMSHMLGMPGTTAIPWWLIVFPGLCILTTVLCVNFIGDGLRDALDPKSEI